jgi:hypothetical protein
MTAILGIRDYRKKIEGSPSRHLITGTIIGSDISGLLTEIFRLKLGTTHFALIARISPNDT